MLTRFRATALALLALSAGSCTALGGSLLVGGPHAPQQDLVARARGAQRELQEARVDFAAACLAYQRLTAPQAVELGRLKNEFEDSVESCEDRARDLDERIDSIREEKQALVKSWTEELARFSSDDVRAKSEAQMRDTDARAQRLLGALERLQGRMKTVLLKLQDYSLFFDHNLSARAIATLQDTYRDFDKEFKSFESELAKAQGEIEEFLAYFVTPAPAKPAS